MPVAVTIDDLPLKVRDRIGHRCCCGPLENEEPNGCWKGCSPHPNVTCQLSGVAEMVWQRGHVVNAIKGSLLMCPATGDGKIGVLLAALTPKQHYTHMGIFLDDGFTVRHATSIRDFDEHFYNGSILGMPAPTNGITADPLKYGWPGTVTQTAEDAWVSSAPVDRLGYLAKTLGLSGASLDKAKAEETNRLQLKDPISQKSVWLDALSFDSLDVYEPDSNGNSVWNRYQALIVRPCNREMIDNPWMQDVLNRVADEARGIAGHYRFYSYSDSAIAEDPAYAGPVVHEKTVFTSDCVETTVTTTVPVVCSTFVWLAMRRVIAAGTVPALMIDDDALENDLSDWLPGCMPAVKPPVRVDYVDPAQPPPDGLYNYTPEQRLRAATALHAKLKQDVADSIAGISGMLTAALALTVAEGIVVSAFLNSILGLSLGSLLHIGLTGAQIDALVELSELPTTVADQICNLFANDGRLSGSGWKDDIGSGVAVGPDNVLWSWAGPRTSDPRIHPGLYGFNTPASFQPGSFGKREPTVWALSPGRGHLQGRVTLQGAQMPWDLSATVTIGCVASTITVQDGWYSVDVPAGRYLVTARATDPISGCQLKAERAFDIPFLEPSTCDLDLASPDPRFRRVFVTPTKVGTRDESLDGDSVKDYEHDGQQEVFVGPFDGRLDWGPNSKSRSTQPYSHSWGIGGTNPDTSAVLELKVGWAAWTGDSPPMADNGVWVEIHMMIREGTKVEAEWRDRVYVPEGGSLDWDHSLRTHDEVQPDHFDLSLNLANHRMGCS